MATKLDAYPRESLDLVAETCDEWQDTERRYLAEHHGIALRGPSRTARHQGGHACKESRPEHLSTRHADVTCQGSYSTIGARPTAVSVPD
jgi:hypothetical protein